MDEEYVKCLRKNCRPDFRSAIQLTFKPWLYWLMDINPTFFVHNGCDQIILLIKSYMILTVVCAFTPHRPLSLISLIFNDSVESPASPNVRFFMAAFSKKLVNDKKEPQDVVTDIHPQFSRDLMRRRSVILGIANIGLFFANLYKKDRYHPSNQSK